MARPLRRLAAPLVLGALPFLLSAGALVASGTLLAACDTGGCEGGALQVEDLVVGTGAEATASSTVTLAYTGTLEDGTVFDQRDSYVFDFSDPENQPIVGFRDGVVGMKVGGQRRITIPPDQGYGEAGYPGVIPPCATLVFEVTLLGVQ